VAAGLAVLQLLIPIRPALRREIHQVPQDFAGADRARILAGLARREAKLRRPEMPDAVSTEIIWIFSG